MTSTPPPPILVGCKTAGQMLGISEVTTYRMVKDGTLPSVRVGRRILIRVADLEAFAGGLPHSVTPNEGPAA